MNCPQCGAETIPGTAFCDNCGFDLSSVPAAGAVPPTASAGPPPLPPTAPAPPQASPATGGAVCPTCGVPVPPDAAFCDNCGASLSGAAPPVPAAAPATPPPAPAPAAGGATCPNCGNQVPPGATFCDNCGASLSGQAPAAAPPAAPPAYMPPPVAPTYAPPMVPPPAGMQMKLVIGATGAQIPLAGKAEFLIGREDPISGVFPEADLTPHGGDVGGVSRKHAKIMVQGNQATFYDLGSTNGSWVDKVKAQPNQPMQLNNGSEIRVGRIVMLFQTS